MPLLTLYCVLADPVLRVGQLGLSSCSQRICHTLAWIVSAITLQLMKHDIKCFHTKLSTKLSFFKVLAIHFYNSTNVVPMWFDWGVSLSFFTFVMQQPLGELGFEEWHGNPYIMKSSSTWTGRCCFHHSMSHPNSFLCFLSSMIDLASFSAPWVDSQHLADLVDTHAYVQVVGCLLEVHTVKYNQECVVQLYDGTAIKVIDGPVSEISSWWQHF